MNKKYFAILFAVLAVIFSLICIYVLSLPQKDEITKNTQYFSDLNNPIACGTGTYYFVNKADTKLLKVYINPEVFDKNKEIQVFNLNNNKDLKITLSEGSNLTINLCTDVLGIGEPVTNKEYRAKTGQVVIKHKNAKNYEDRFCNEFYINITLQNVSFGKSKLQINELTYDEVWTGWCPG